MKCRNDAERARWLDMRTDGRINLELAVRIATSALGRPPAPLESSPYRKTVFHGSGRWGWRLAVGVVGLIVGETRVFEPFTPIPRGLKTALVILY